MSGIFLFLFKNWKALATAAAVIAVAYGAFAIYRFIDELHDRQAELEQTIADKDRQIDNLNVELVQERARIKTITTILDQRDADLAESNRLRELLDGTAAGADARIKALEQQLKKSRAASKDRLFSGDPKISDAELDAINKDVNCAMNTIAGGVCD